MPVVAVITPPLPAVKFAMRFSLANLERAGGIAVLVPTNREPCPRVERVPQAASASALDKRPARRVHVGESAT
jgi:hypothetical protein